MEKKDNSEKLMRLRDEVRRARHAKRTADRERYVKPDYVEHLRPEDILGETAKWKRFTDEQGNGVNVPMHTGLCAITHAWLYAYLNRDEAMAQWALDRFRANRNFLKRRFNLSEQVIGEDITQRIFAKDWDDQEDEPTDFEAAAYLLQDALTYLAFSDDEAFGVTLMEFTKQFDALLRRHKTTPHKKRLITEMYNSVYRVSAGVYDVTYRVAPWYTQKKEQEAQNVAAA